ncbi:hypothetical protein D0869_10866 [Hortaea werneckii]|uniref:MYND-type domain-containing protein n=1 Tax=Hortaea werneckii TaxID=91943 RepID=A0A3M6WDF4_HORWE|nr:hypothetical protein D0869_10866 [Hortaea werneckii]
MVPSHQAFERQRQMMRQKEHELVREGYGLRSYIAEHDSSKSWVQRHIEFVMQEPSSAPHSDESWRPTSSPSSHGRLSMQYTGVRVGGKRKRADADGNGIRRRKRLRKRHRRLTSPAPGVQSAADCSPVDQRASNELTTTPRRMRANALLRPSRSEHSQPAQPKRDQEPEPAVEPDTFCSGCERENHLDGGSLEICPDCHVTAYCSLRCKSDHAAEHETLCRARRAHRARKANARSALEDKCGCHPDGGDRMDVVPESSTSALHRAAAHHGPVASDTVREEISEKRKPESKARVHSLDEVQNLVKSWNEATGWKPEKVYHDDSQFQTIYLQETISLLKAESERMSSQVSMDWAQRGFVEGGTLTAKGEALAREKARERMVEDGPVRPITVDQDSTRRSSSGDKEMVGVHDLKPTQTRAPKCQAGPHAKVVKMNYAGPLRHHRVRNHRFLDYLVGSEWVPADSLLGPPWDAKIEAYWSVATRQKFRGIMDIPHPSCLHEPGPLGRYIKRAEIREGRWLFFDVRDFERHDDPNEMLAEEGSDLGPEWEQALQKHWRRVEIAWERMLQSEDMDSLGLSWMSSMPKRDSLVSDVQTKDQGTKMNHQDQRRGD